MALYKSFRQSDRNFGDYLLNVSWVHYNWITWALAADIIMACIDLYGQLLDEVVGFCVNTDKRLKLPTHNTLHMVAIVMDMLRHCKLPRVYKKTKFRGLNLILSSGKTGKGKKLILCARLGFILPPSTVGQQNKFSRPFCSIWKWRQGQPPKRCWIIWPENMDDVQNFSYTYDHTRSSRSFKFDLHKASLQPAIYI